MAAPAVDHLDRVADGGDRHGLRAAEQRVAGMAHPSFTDIGLVGEHLGLDLGADTPAARGADITRAYVRAFFDRHLRGTPRPLLDQPSSRYPEVIFAR